MQTQQRSRSMPIETTPEQLSNLAHLPIGNWLLAALEALDPDEFAELEDALRPVELAPGTTLVDIDQRPSSLLFVDAGLISVVTHTAAGEALEVGFVGTEGVTTAGWLLGGGVPPYTFVARLPVSGRRLDAADARRILSSQGRFDCLLRIYGQFLIEQLMQSVVCARFHNTTERLARLLLTISDRLGTDTIPRTHESLAPVVGAPRSVVTEAVGTLRRAGCLDASRGRVAIMDRRKLQEQACECFATDLARRQTFFYRLTARNPAS